MYSIEIKKQAQRKLKNLAAPDRRRITEAIIKLGTNPNSQNLDIRLLTGQNYWRMRIGSWRIIYAKDNTLRVIAIEKIKARGDAYK